MNIEFDSYKQKLGEIKPNLDGLADSLNLEGLKNELERLQAMQEAPGFWDNPEKSQQIVVKTKITESKIEKYKQMVSSWDDLMTICEMAAEEDDDSMLPELKDADLTVEIKRYRKKRSLDANAYCWVLLDKLAEATGVPKSEIYRHAVRDIGGNSQVVCVLEKAAPKLCEGWERNGLGWTAEVIPSKLDGCVNVILYYGSSLFDAGQMSRLIDGLVQDCKALGIETMPPDKLNSLLEAWNG